MKKRLSLVHQPFMKSRYKPCYFSQILVLKQYQFHNDNVLLLTFVCSAFTNVVSDSLQKFKFVW
jgi:hypothetical protein